MKFNFLKMVGGLWLLSVVFSPAINIAAQQLADAPKTGADVHMEIVHDSFVYSPQGRRDPFEPLIPQEHMIAEVVKKTRPDKIKGPLEKFELKQFRLLAIMVVSGTPRAMVKAPDGKSYTVKIGDYVGMNGGLVKAIQTKVIDTDDLGMRIEKSPDRIVIEETGVDSITGKEVKENRYIVM